MKLVLLGPPGSGKGTHAMWMCGEYKIPHISTGAMLREEERRNPHLYEEVRHYIDRGELVPDELIFEILKERLAESDCRDGYILDGFPRTLKQAEMLEALGGVDLAVMIDTVPELIMERVRGRRVCPRCGKGYHISQIPGGKCTDCGAEVTIRSDDKPETIRNRFDVYDRVTHPLVEHYKNEGKLARIDGSGTIGEVAAEIRALLNGGV